MGWYDGLEEAPDVEVYARVRQGEHILETGVVVARRDAAGVKKRGEEASSQTSRQS